MGDLSSGLEEVRTLLLFWGVLFFGIVLGFVVKAAISTPGPKRKR